jgi:cytochrome c peroxidase
MTRKLCGVVLFASLLLWTGVASLAEGAKDHDPPAQRESYRRPTAIPYPDANPYSAAKAELGRMLFFDPILSGSRTRSCASCHNPGLSWGDGRAVALGDGSAPMALRSPTLLGVAWLPRLGWDGKFRDVEAVTFAAISGPANMNLAEAEAIERLAAIPGYVHAFAEVFGASGITHQNIEQVLATYERSIIPGEAPFDRWVGGDEGAISDAARRGFALFTGHAGCAECHSGWVFTDGSFHDIGTARGDDIGRGRLFPTSLKLRYAFKVPTLRDVARRAPYMHDGSVPTLEAVVDLYDRGGIERPSRSPLIRRLGLSEGEKADLVAFLRTLTGPPQPVEVPVLPR